MKVSTFGDWFKVQKILSESGKKLETATKKAVLQEGQFFRNKIVEGFDTQAPGGDRWSALSTRTLVRRAYQGFKGTKALIVRGDLRNSVAVVQQGGEVFVGVQRTKKNKDGKSLVNIAEIHEFGFGPWVIIMSAKMRRFLHAMFSVLGVPPKPTTGSTGMLVINIPARPFLRPIWAKYGSPPDQVANRFLSRLAHLLDGDFGLLGPPPPTK